MCDSQDNHRADVIVDDRDSGEESSGNSSSNNKTSLHCDISSRNKVADLMTKVIYGQKHGQLVKNILCEIYSNQISLSWNINP